jgi:ribosomal protein S18 acetylase RimI-like enzyme
MQTMDTVIRSAQESDLPALGRLGALLMQRHYEFDRNRFIAPDARAAEGYAGFLGSQLCDKDVAVLVADRGGVVVGYVYAALEPKSWKELREAAGFIHDVAVEETCRQTGIATELVQAAVQWLQDRGVPRVMLWTAQQNTIAARLFSRLGFRPTMIEMTRELSEQRTK